MSYSLFDWILLITGKTIPLVIPLLLNSTVICVTGLLMCLIMGKKGALIQSWILRICLVTVILSPIISFVSTSSDLSHINITVNYPDTFEKVYSSDQRKETASELSKSGNAKVDFQRTGNSAKTGLGRDVNHTVE